MWGKTLSRVLPAPFISAFITAVVFLLVVTGALYYLKQFDSPVAFIQNLLVSPVRNSTSVNEYEVIGFLPSWSVAKKVKFNTEDLTQIIYFGLGVNSRGEVIQFDSDGEMVQEWAYFNSEYFKTIRDQAKKSDTKVLIAIKSFDNKNIDDLISNPVLSAKFIDQLAKIVKEQDLDGVNIDFEYFTDSNFPTFKYLNQFFIALNQKLKTENPDLIISADFNASVVALDPAYDMVKLGEVIDQIILMGYDYSTTASTQARPVAPLYSEKGEHSIDNSIKSLKGRVPLDKVVLAIPFYGYEWQTINSTFQSQTVPNTGAVATYDRVTQLINNRNDIEINWDSKSQTPWLTYQQSGAYKQIYFENEQSISKKLDYIKKAKLAGVGIWAIGYEGESGTFWELMNKFRK